MKAFQIGTQVAVRMKKNDSTYYVGTIAAMNSAGVELDPVWMTESHSETPDLKAAPVFIPWTSVLLMEAR